jgi:class 3 adenylate cyclase
VIRCPSCGHENPQGSQFCNGCGSPVTSAPSVRREERKFVTVLFADMVGFTSRAESMDPEDVRTVLSSYHERVRHELERFGGTVEKFIGDAVMAAFGAPQTHEDIPNVRCGPPCQSATGFATREPISSSGSASILGKSS